MKYVSNFFLVILIQITLCAACSKSADVYSVQPPSSSSAVGWSYDGSDWKASGTPPACPEPLAIQSPVDVSLATAVLYPGQTRGGDYKAHGGIRFDGQKNDAIQVSAPMDAEVYEASRYIERGETQYLFVFIAPCGLMYRFDHLLTLSPAMRAIADTLPEAKPDDSRTTRIQPPVSVKAGDTIATAVGFVSGPNVSVDFGFYDLRKKNIASQNASYAVSHSVDQAQHAICWFDLLPAADAVKVKNLPAGDGVSGKSSDYCQ